MDKEKILWVVIWVFVLCVVAVYLWSAAGSHMINYCNSAHSYHNPFVLFMAMSIFVLFDRMNFCGGFINVLAKSAFTIFLLHQHFLRFCQ
jgi:hypothetical protein